MSSATEGRRREGGDSAEASLSSAVYSVELQSKSQAIVDHKQPFK